MQGKKDDNQVINIACLCCQGQIGECPDIQDMIGDLYPEWGAQWYIQILYTPDENEGIIGQITTRSMKKTGKKYCQCVPAKNLPHQVIKNFSPTGNSVNKFGVPVKRNNGNTGATVNLDEEYSK